MAAEFFHSLVSVMRRMPCRLPNGVPLSVWRVAKGAFGNAVFGSMWFGMTKTMRPMSITAISTLKHGLVEQMADWSCSTFHRYVEPGRVRTAYHFNAQIILGNETFRRNLTHSQYCRKTNIHA
jgi:hypothetical protein